MLEHQKEIEPTPTEICEARSECRPRTRTNKGIEMDFEIALKKRNKAGKDLKRRIHNVYELLRLPLELVKLTACTDGLDLEMKRFRDFNDHVLDLCIIRGDDDKQEEEFSTLWESSLECMANLKTKIKDLEFQRAELLSQRSSKRNSRSSKSSTTSSARRAAIEAATLKEKMKSLQRKQEIDRKQDELERQQRELQRQEEEEDLRAELSAAEAIKGLLVQDTEEEKPKAIKDITQIQDPFDITQLSHFTPKRNDIIVSEVTPPAGSCMVVKPDTGNPIQQHTGNPTQENTESQGLMEFSEKFMKGKPPPTTDLYDERKTQKALPLTRSSRTNNAEKKKEPNAKSLTEERPPKPAVNPQEYAVDVPSSTLASLTPHGGHSSLPTHFDVNTPAFVPQPRIGSTPVISHMPPSMNYFDASWQFQSIQRENAEIQRGFFSGSSDFPPSVKINM